MNASDLLRRHRLLACSTIGCPNSAVTTIALTGGGHGCAPDGSCRGHRYCRECADKLVDHGDAEIVIDPSEIDDSEAVPVDSWMAGEADTIKPT